MGFEFGKMKENNNLTAFALGALAAAIGAKAMKSQAAHDLCVKGLANGMKLQNEAKAAFENMKEDAQDLYYDAKQEAGIHSECGCCGSQGEDE